MDKIQFRIWNIKEERPASVYEINRLVNEENDNQLFFNWMTHPTLETEGIVQVDLDSGYGKNFQLKIIDSTEFI